MADTKLRNDASSSTDGTVYQFYVALKYAFELPINKKLFIERFGDVTIESVSQIEVKKYQENLTDSHENLWNTLYNWLDSKFIINDIEVLMLLTTQSIGPRSTLKDWNLKDSNQKLKILEEIYKKYLKQKKRDKSKEELMKNVLELENRKRLETVLSKFIIVDSTPDDVELFNQLCMKYARFIPKNNQDKYIKALLGYVISPKEKGKDKWEIMCSAFDTECQELAGVFVNGTNLFPRNTCSEILQYDKYKEHLFVKKIKEINYHEEIKTAIKEYAEIHSLVINEFLRRQVCKKKYDEYEDEIKKDYKRLYRKACRNVSSGNFIKESQNFYDDIMTESAPQFMNYIDTPKTFRNGILHINANDTKEDVKWKLGVNNG
ncbi:hypothetical protein [Clostridium drakei]|uniref:CD-NTase associated protein 4-like DNA endonuclease domain-containing protein n=1 Tax=Clostridium drakei TaxID=332101 RepID=A0A2U8DVT7_9CLOT|nr:hypothetical protein [Clostridium drakei]AWI06759.1 hypothetical protein B9W14_20410 [Clostridium drakei]